MKKTLYVKYNSHRAPQFRIRTEIFEENGKKYVEKHPLSKDATAHVEKMIENRTILSEVFNRVEVIPAEKSGDGVRFPFISGEAVTKDIDFKNDSLEAIKKKLLTIFSVIFDFKEGVVNEGKVSPANIDSNLSNFILKDSKVYLIDYEWVETDPVPLNFLKFRTLLFTYIEHFSELSGRIDQGGFLSLFGFKEEATELFLKMEDAFSQEIHGENKRYMYALNYEKEVKRFSDMEARLLALEAENAHLRQIIEAKDDVIDKKDDTVGQVYTQFEFFKEAVSKPLPRNPIKKRKILEQQEEERLKKEQEKAEKIRFKEETDAKVPALLKELSGEYETWIKKVEAGYEKGESFSYNPLISVVVPVYNVKSEYLEACIQSVLNQTYKNFELVLVDDKSTMPEILPILKRARSENEKVKAVFSKENGGISAATNLGIKEAKGEFIAFLDCDDLLSENALYENVKLLNQDKTFDMIYSDEDKLSEDGSERSLPVFKPDFSPDTLFSYNYICHLTLIRKSLLDEIGGLNSEFDGAQDHDLALRVAEKTEKIGHVSKILYHWRMIGGSTADSLEAKPYAISASVKAREASLKRRGLKGFLEEAGNAYRTVFEPDGEPLVSVVIPSKDHPEVLSRALSTFRAFSDYKNYEFIVVDNGSSEENKARYEALLKEHEGSYIHEERDFNFSYMCNRGATEAQGEFILFLNDDIEVINERWLRRMVGTAALPHAGAVGAKLYYPDREHLQHDGVVNANIGPCHIFPAFTDKENHHYNRNVLDFDVIAVTAACLLVSKAKYDEVGGFNEDLAVAYNDVEFCFKLHEAGYYNIIRNDVSLVHHESLSRGNDMVNRKKTDRLLDEWEILYGVHPKMLCHDPFYNENLNQYYVDFTPNTDADFDFSCIETKDSFEEGSPGEILFHINQIDVNWGVQISGWCIFKTRDNTTPMDILIRDQNGKSFILKAKKTPRYDVCGLYEDAPGGLLCGFKTLTDRHLVPNGAYNIFFLKDGAIFDTGKMVYKGVEPFDYERPTFSLVALFTGEDTSYVEESLMAFSEQDYPYYEVCIANRADPLHAPVIEILVGEHKEKLPGIRYRSIPVRFSENADLERMMDFAKGDRVVIIENPKIERNFLSKLEKEIKNNKDKYQDRIIYL